ncbi:MAG: tRNA (adenosine(37)-N6)-threonylcarbamoyltransferase complex ATPase subunit type 1 TsaE [Planctomycetota bacterium]
MFVVSHVDLDRLQHFTEVLVRHAPAELTIGLVGTLGAGKTTLTQCLAEAAGVDRDDVTSPTFTLMSTYQATIHAGTVALHHLDAYRLADEDEFLELGVEELFESAKTWVLIEWADRVESVMPESTLWIEIDIDAEDAPLHRRKLTLRYHADADSWIQRLRHDMDDSMNERS